MSSLSLAVLARRPMVALNGNSNGHHTPKIKLVWYYFVVVVAFAFLSSILFATNDRDDASSSMIDPVVEVRDNSPDNYQHSVNVQHVVSDESENNKREGNNGNHLRQLNLPPPAQMPPTYQDDLNRHQHRHHRRVLKKGSSGGSDKGKGKGKGKSKKSQKNETATDAVTEIETETTTATEMEEEDNIMDNMQRNLIDAYNKKVEDEKTTMAETQNHQDENEIRNNPCHRVNVEIGIDHTERQACLDYESLAYIKPDCSSNNGTSLLNVPKIYHSVGPVPAASPINHYRLSIALSNPEYVTNHHDDDTAKQYVLEKCGFEAYEAYSCLIPPAYRADLFRFCALYKDGGVYLDSDLLPLVPLEDLYSECSVATLGYDFPQGPQGRYQGKQMKILASQPNAPIFKCALETTIYNIRNRVYPEAGPLAVSGPLLLHKCYDQFPDKVAITYHDTRHAKWPYTGLRAGDRLLAYEMPLRKSHFKELGNEPGENDYGKLFYQRQIYQHTCKLLPTIDGISDIEFTFPSVEERVKYYMGGWDVEEGEGAVSEASTGNKLCGYHQASWYNVKNNKIETGSVQRFDLEHHLHWATNGPMVFDVPTLHTISQKFNTNDVEPLYYSSNVIQYLVPHWKTKTQKNLGSGREEENDQPLFLLHLGDEKRLYDVPVMTKARPTMASEAKSYRKNIEGRDYSVVSGSNYINGLLLDPIIVPIEVGRHFGNCINIVKENDTMDWTLKQDVLVWRGATTGTRVELLQGLFDKMKGYYPSKPSEHDDNYIDFDIGFTWFVQGYEDASDEFKQQLGKPHLSIQDQLSYKFLLSLEGNDVASGLKWQLYSNSVVFMPIPSTASWAMEDKLVPYYHYIPLEDDLSDLYEKVQWAKHNDALCQTISRHATQFIEDLWISEKAKEETEQILSQMVQIYQDSYGDQLKLSPTPTSSSFHPDDTDAQTTTEAPLATISDADGHDGSKAVVIVSEPAPDQENTVRDNDAGRPPKTNSPYPRTSSRPCGGSSSGGVAVSKSIEDIPQFLFQSQDGEDKILLQWFNNLCDGTYIEMGALDGVHLSNSFVFNAHLGWKGILIEASPSSFQSLVKNRPNEIATIHTAICDTKRDVHYVEDYAGREVRGILEFAPVSFRQQHWNEDSINHATKIECHPLKDVLQQHVAGGDGDGGGFHFDFFSLDVEGGELEVLKTLDFQIHTFGVILVEADEHDQLKNLNVRSLLESNGYIFLYEKGRSYWFYNKDFYYIYGRRTESA